MLRSAFHLFAGLLTISLLCHSCSDKHPSGKPLFDLMEHTGIDFDNKVVDQRLDNSFLFRNF